MTMKSRIRRNEHPLDAIHPNMDAVFAAVAVERKDMETAFGDGGVFAALRRYPTMYVLALTRSVKNLVVALRAKDEESAYTAAVRLASVACGIAEATLPEGASAATPAVPEEHPTVAAEAA